MLWMLRNFKESQKYCGMLKMLRSNNEHQGDLRNAKNWILKVWGLPRLWWIYINAVDFSIYVWLRGCPLSQKRLMKVFKGLISGNLEPTARGRDSTFTFCHALLKKAVLQGKRANRPDIFSSQCTWCDPWPLWPMSNSDFFCILFYHWRLMINIYPFFWSLKVF